jgi:hypothetical protein
VSLFSRTVSVTRRRWSTEPLTAGSKTPSACVIRSQPCRNAVGIGLVSRLSVVDTVSVSTQASAKPSGGSRNVTGSPVPVLYQVIFAARATWAITAFLLIAAAWRGI